MFFLDMVTWNYPVILAMYYGNTTVFWTFIHFGHALPCNVLVHWFLYIWGGNTMILLYHGTWKWKSFSIMVYIKLPWWYCFSSLVNGETVKLDKMKNQQMLNPTSVLHYFCLVKTSTHFTSLNASYDSLYHKYFSEETWYAFRSLHNQHIYFGVNYVRLFKPITDAWK